MNWVDLALLAIFLLAVWAGYHRGFILGSLDLASWAGSFIAAYMLFGYTKVLLEKLFDLNVWLLPVSFLLTLLVARLIFGLMLFNGLSILNKPGVANLHTPFPLFAG